MEMEPVVHPKKTKDYTLRATKAYYEKNKALIQQKQMEKRFYQTFNELFEIFFDESTSTAQRWAILHKISEYKLYQNNAEIREKYRASIDRMLASLDCNGSAAADLSFLLLSRN